MAVIYLTHPVFGDKVATSDLEAEYDLRNGWSRVTASAEDAPGEDAEVNSLLAAARAARRRRAPAQEG
jgi:hypothetical protein